MINLFSIRSEINITVNDTHRENTSSKHIPLEKCLNIIFLVKTGIAVFLIHP